MIDPIKADQIIGSLLDELRETRSVEFKPSIPWHDINTQVQLQEIVKSVIGMSNIRDGGKIILGVSQNPDKTFNHDGMLDTDIKTYDQDRIYQIVKTFCNPAPRFDLINAEYKNKYYLVFIVQEFLYSPLICARNGKDGKIEPLVKGALYIRNFKPETKRVDNESEMREIINLAIDKEIDNWSPRIEKIIVSQKEQKPLSKIDTDKFNAEMKDL